MLSRQLFLLIELYGIETNLSRSRSLTTSLLIELYGIETTNRPTKKRAYLLLSPFNRTIWN